MHRTSFVVALAMTVTLTMVASAESCCKELAYSLTPIQQSTQADVVVVGKVCDLEPDVVMLEQYQGGGKVAHIVATIRIEEGLVGAKGLTHLRVAYVPSQRQVYAEEFGIQQLQRRERFWRGQASLTQGQEGCFFLQKHARADLLVPVNMGYPLDKSSFNFDDEMKAVRNILRAVDKPLEVLRSKDAGERQLAACALVSRYRQQRNTTGTVAVTNEALSAEESKLILSALGEMKWGELPFDSNGTFSLQNVFWQLQLTDKDGWQQPQQKENQDYNAIMGEAVTKWLKGNAEKYRVQRLVFNSAKAH
jgi:hypothetical protein